MQVLGVEAVRTVIVKELDKVFSFDGTYVNYRHLALLSDLMCWSGQLLPLINHRISGQDMGPLRRASVRNTVSLMWIKNF